MLEELLEGMERSAETACSTDAAELQKELTAYREKYESALQMGQSDAAQVYEKQIAQLEEALEGPAEGGGGEVSFCGRGSDLAKDSRELREARRGVYCRELMENPHLVKWRALLYYQLDEDQNIELFTPRGIVKKKLFYHTGAGREVSAQFFRGLQQYLRRQVKEMGSR